MFFILGLVLQNTVLMNAIMLIVEKQLKNQEFAKHVAFLIQQLKVLGKNIVLFNVATNKKLKMERHLLLLFAQI
jgi:hypothetical protein